MVCCHERRSIFRAEFGLQENSGHDRLKTKKKRNFSQLILRIGKGEVYNESVWS